jgi:phage anti-repressor protein
MSVDIVNLIESNPITKFSGDYQTKLIEKVKQIFTNYEQQLFLSSFYCYLKYNSKNDFVIDLDNVWKWLGFSSKFNAKRLLENKFIINKDYKLLLLQSAKQSNQTKGGHNKETFVLNIETFKKFCLKSDTKKADEVHEYFIKLENIMFEITKEESDELKQQLEKIEDTKNKETEEKLIKQKEVDNEKYLLKQYAMSGPLVYVIKVKTFENGTYIVKIGESRKGIQNRYNEHKSKYDECLLLHCLQVDKSHEFEQFLHSHKDIHPTKVSNLTGHEKETELFLIGTTLTMQTVIKIIDDNIGNYNYKVRELLLEIENLKLKNNGQIVNNNDELLKELIQNNKFLTNKVTSLENSIQLIINKLNTQETKVVTGFNQQMPHLGPRLQKINPETLQLVKIYESVTDAMNEDKNIKRPSIAKAVEENTIYCGFRWLLVERNLDPNVIHEIQPTKQTTSQNVGYIAKLNANKTEILNVYLDRKTAARLNGYKSLSALDNPVKKNTITNNHYYMLYNNCDTELIDTFESKNGAPILLYKNGIGQYDLRQQLVREFGCKYDCIRELKMSDKTLAKSLSNNIPFNKYYYKELGCKLSIN